MFLYIFEFHGIVHFGCGGSLGFGAHRSGACPMLATDNHWYSCFGAELLLLVTVQRLPAVHVSVCTLCAYIRMSMCM